MPIHGYPGNVITANPTAPTVSSASGVWTTEQQLLAVSQGNWPGYEYPISRSLRFNSADSAYLNRTPASAGNQQKWTWSGWVKRSTLGAKQIFGAGAGTAGSPECFIDFEDNFNFQIFDGTSNLAVLRSSAVYRDPSAWYHAVVAVDTTQATASNRVLMYINGQQITAFTLSTYPSQNLNTQVNATTAHRISSSTRVSAYYYDGYLTEVNFIDGQALTPSSFGLNDPETGVWSPKRYTGTYGTNGFYLNFSDNSGTTSTTLGKDYSGNGNNWTPNNFSVTAGAGNDSLVDSPTNYGTDTGVGGEVRGNYCTLNPLIPAAAGVTLSDGNLRYTNTSGGANQWYTTFIGVSGAFYYEATCTTRGASDQYNYVGDGNALYATNGQIYIGGSLITTVATYTSGDVIGVAFGGAGGSGLQFFKNGTQVYSASASGGNTPIVNGYNSCVWDMNFGQRPFAYTAPSGFKALCTQNLPTPTIGATSTTQANDYMNVVTYTGTLSTVGSNQLVTGVGFQPDFTWIKCRSNAANHIIADSLRYVSTTNNNTLNSNTADAEADDQNTFRGFDSDGFNVGYYDVTGNTGKTYVAWNWKANGAGSSNTAGTITSTVSANTTSGFSIVTYTGNGTSGATIGHGLGVAPSMIMIKERATALWSWGVYHASVGNTAGLYLNLTNAAATTSVFWNNTSPTSSVFSVGNWGGVNGNTSTYVAYCFAPVAGYSAFGSYLANASTDGPLIFCGFRPRFIMIKGSVAGNNWVILDTARDTYNVAQNLLYPNLSNAEAAGAALDILSNGFKIRASGGDVNFSSGATYIYAAFAESPFKYALAR